MPAQPPPIPPELLERFGEPEHAFGPNMRFRTKACILGSMLILIGVSFLIFGFLDKDAQRFGRGGAAVMFLLGGCVLFMGGVSVYYPLRLSRDWIFVCPRGLVRYLNHDWETLDWSNALRFEDVSLPQVRQCRIDTADGSKWGFIADLIADYKRLTEVLAEKLKAKAAA
jgi:hypothetical protein